MSNPDSTVGAIGRGGEREVYHPPKQILSEADLISVDDELYEELKKEDQLQLSDHLMDDLRGGSGSAKWRPEDKIMAATYYMILGTYDKAAEYMKASGVPVPRPTIAFWRQKSTWWKPLTQQIRKAKQEELDAKLTHVIHSGVEALQDRIDGGEYVLRDKTGEPEIVRVPMKSRDLSIVTGTMYDKRALGRGDPTSRTEKTAPEQALRELAKQFEEFARGKKTETIEAVKTEYSIEDESNNR